MLTTMLVLALLGQPKMMYTTYFYTAGEAVVHGYADGTSVRIVDLARQGTVWQGVVDRGRTRAVQTGQGSFAFLSDKKAAILVGTPSQCAVVGYWVPDENGDFRVEHVFTQLPSSTSSNSTSKLIVWAHEDVNLTITDLPTQDGPAGRRDEPARGRTGTPAAPPSTSAQAAFEPTAGPPAQATTSRSALTPGRSLYSGRLKAGAWYELDAQRLADLNSHVLEIRADRKAISVQVYYDEGFFVPAHNGRGTGKQFSTYLGAITNGVNDLILISYAAPAKVTVRDLRSGAEVWKGTVPAGGRHTMTLSDRYLGITSDKEISVAVAPFEHYKGGYAEHHFCPGQEGSGIDNTFLLPTPGSLWLFSYFSDNPVTVTNADSGAVAWQGTLGKGMAAALEPGYGFYKVKAAKGLSVMGGYGACDAKFSPAGGMFAVDEALFAVLQQLREERRQAAAAQGRTLSASELEAPMTRDEAKKAASYLKSRAKTSAPTGAAAGPAPAAAASMSDDEIMERAAEVQSQSR